MDLFVPICRARRDAVFLSRLASREVVFPLGFDKRDTAARQKQTQIRSKLLFSLNFCVNVDEKKMPIEYGYPL